MSTALAIYNPGFKFAMFGCWNQLDVYNETDDTINKSDNAEKVITELKKEANLSFIVIAGDNYYPIKIKTKTKTTTTTTTTENLSIIRESSLRSGFKLLPTNVPIYLMYGNHDLDNSLSLIKYETKPTGTGASPSKEECAILKTENKIVIETPNLKRPSDKTLVMFEKIGNTVIIMLDTSMYSMPSKDPTLECYKELLGNVSMTPETLMQQQMTEVMGLLNSVTEDSIKNVIIIGHHPLLYVKPKKDKIKADPLHVKAFDLMFAISEKIGPTKKYFYLCADLHNYQQGELKIKKTDSSPEKTLTIQQYVVGTGGTRLDDAINLQYELKNTKLQGSPYVYEYDILSSEKTTGYLICENGGGTDDLKFEFKQVPTGAAAGGKKTRKRKKVKKTKRRKPKHIPLRITR